MPGHRMPRYQRIRVVASSVVLLAVWLFVGNPPAPAWAAPIDLPGSSPRVDLLLCLPLIVAGALGLRRALSSIASSDTGGAASFAAPADALAWLPVFAGLLGCGLSLLLHRELASTTSLMAGRLLLAGTCAALLGAVVTERVGPREGLLGLPVLLAFAGLAVLLWWWQDDARYLLWLAGLVAVVAPLLTLLLPGAYDRAWDGALGASLAAAGGLAAWTGAAGEPAGPLLGNALPLLWPLAALLLLHHVHRRRALPSPVTDPAADVESWP
jgi:hypothetical protein